MISIGRLTESSSFAEISGGERANQPLDISEPCLTLASVLIAPGFANCQEEYHSSDGTRPSGLIPTQRIAAAKL
jgi:hypothetical protein